MKVPVPRCSKYFCPPRFRWRLGDASILQSPKLVDSAFKLSPVRRALAEVPWLLVPEFGEHMLTIVNMFRHVQHISNMFKHIDNI